MKPICRPCHRFFRPKKTGIYFLEGMPADLCDDPKPGLAEPEKWRPYKLWSGDLWMCPSCQTEIIVGTGISPVAEHYEQHFEAVVQSYRAAEFQVNDC
jgi:hypothetical protein